MGEGFIIEVLVALNSYHQRSLLQPAIVHYFSIFKEGWNLEYCGGRSLEYCGGGALYTVEGGALCTVLVFTPQSNVSGSHHMSVS